MPITIRVRIIPLIVRFEYQHLICLCVFYLNNTVITQYGNPSDMETARGQLIVILDVHGTKPNC